MHSSANSPDIHSCPFGNQALIQLLLISLRLPFASATAKPIPCGKPHPRTRSPRATGLVPSRSCSRGRIPSPSPGAARTVTGKTVTVNPPSISAHQDAPLRPRKTITAGAAASSFSPSSVESSPSSVGWLPSRGFLGSATSHDSCFGRGKLFV